MPGTNWSRVEIEAIVEDYLSMLRSELSGTSYSKAAHRRALARNLDGRSEQSIEFKHANISAVLIEHGFPFIGGYKPRSNYQSLLADVALERLQQSPELLKVAESDADRLVVAAPEVDDILAVLIHRPPARPLENRVGSPRDAATRLSTNFLEREARNRSLGLSGEKFILNFERARLIAADREFLAARIEHTSQVRGDHEGYDILSFESSGAERLIEVKTTKYGIETPFFVTRNEVDVSERSSSNYQLYRLFAFCKAPRLYTLPGAIGRSCSLEPATYRAQPH